MPKFTNINYIFVELRGMLKVERDRWLVGSETVVIDSHGKR